MVLLRSRSSRTTVTTTGIFRGHALVVVHTILLLLLFAHPRSCSAGLGFDDDDRTCDKIDVDDNTCIVDRSVIGPIKAIVHGTKNDPFWAQVHAGMKQTAEDMNIDLEMILYDDEDPTLDESTLALAMVEDIRRYAGYATSGDDDVHRRTSILGSHVTENSSVKSIKGRTVDEGNDNPLPLLPAAMIVSLPGDSRIEDELKKLQNSNIPIFGINAIGSNDNGDDDASSLFQGTVSMNETQAGVMAGIQIRDILVSKDKNSDGSGTTGVFINHRSDVHALSERFEALSAATQDIVESWEMVHLKKNTTEEEFMAIFEGCRDTVIQLAGGSGTIDAVLSALVANGCNIEDDHIVGTFDTSSPLIYDAMAEGTIKFAVSQQPYLQGSYAVLMAALYATTGQKLTSAGASANPTNVQTGPILVTTKNDNFPRNEQQICEHEGFPVCSSDGSGGRTGTTSDCSCTDRSEISISVITHDESSMFWDTIFSGISQAATDFGVSIQKNQFKQVTPLSQKRTKQHGASNVARLKHTFDINEACQSKTTDGLIVSLPDASMVDALAGCASHRIPYLAINAVVRGFGDELEGEDTNPSVGPLLQYVGQKDYESGLEAGRRLIEAGVKRGWCLVHTNFDTINERCRGMEMAFFEARSDDGNVKFMGIIHVPNNNDIPLYKTTVERMIGQAVDEGDWSGNGVLSTGRIQIPALLSLVEDHPEMLAGTFDFDSALYRNDKKTLPDQIVFGIDQNAYMQGYLSVATMVWRISTLETSITTILETGPNFVVQSDPSSNENASPVALQAHRQHECRNKSIKFCGSHTNKEDQPYEEQPLTFPGKCKDLGRPCGVCEGDCDDDTNCGEGLVCFVRDSLTKGQDDPVPGCNTNPYDWTSKDFCVDARVYTCKDAETIDVRVGTFSMKRTCAFVRDDTSRCKEYGRFCRETCGYCRTEPGDGTLTDY